jgi:hypothetical protein
MNTANILTGGTSKALMSTARLANNAGVRNAARALASGSHSLNRTSKTINSYTKPIDTTRNVLNTPYFPTQRGGYQDNTRVAPVVRPVKPKMQTGGQLPEDYEQFKKFQKTLPNNLKDSNYKYNDPNSYDLYGMWDASNKPNSFSDVKDSDLFPLQDDGTYHGFSVSPKTGEFLKPKNHPSTWMEVYQAQFNPDLQNQAIIQNEKGRLQYVPRTMQGGGEQLSNFEKIEDVYVKREMPKVDFYESWNPKNWGLRDYSAVSNFNDAYSRAKSSNQKVFFYKGKRYNTKSSLGTTPTQEYSMYRTTDAYINSKADEETKKRILKESLEYTGFYDVDPEYLNRRLKINELSGNPSYKHTTTNPEYEALYKDLLYKKNPSYFSKEIEKVSEYDKNNKIEYNGEYGNHHNKYTDEKDTRSKFIPILNNIYGHDYLSEEGHAYRNNQEESEIKSFLKSYAKYPFISNKGQNEGYLKKDHFEFDTHSIVEPVLTAFAEGNIKESEIKPYIEKLRKLKNNEEEFNKNISNLKISHPYHSNENETGGYKNGGLKKSYLKTKRFK